MIDRNRTVADIVLDHSETAAVFQRHRIDFCCKGQMSVTEACRAHGIEPTVLLAELESAVEGRAKTGEDPRRLATPALVAYIVTHHHQYLRKAMPFVRQLAAKVARVHGDHEPKLRELGPLVEALVEALEPHLDEEEEVLFPELVARGADATKIAKDLGSMHEEHLAVGSLLERIRAAASDYAVPDWACNSYRTLFAELQALETDVHTHVHLENHVLMPRFVS